MKKTNPLAGKRILVTRPREQAGSLTHLLTEHGAKVTELPLIRIGPPSSWEPFDTCFSAEIIYDWIIFASVNAVESTIDRLRYLNKTERLNLSKLAAIGPATKAALGCSGLTANFCPRSYVAESFVEEFPDTKALGSAKILWPKTNIGRTLIADKLREYGACVDIVHCYSTHGPDDPALCSSYLKRVLAKNQLDIITLTSSETARNLHKLLLLQASEQSTTVTNLLQNVKLAVIGPQTAQTAQKLLGRVDIQADEFTLQGLVNAIEKQTTA